MTETVLDYEIVGRPEVIEAVMAVQFKKGEIRAEDVVESAKDPASPLHQFFDWDVESAAKKHWLATARRVIRMVQIQVQFNETKKSVPLFIPHPKLRTGYISLLELGQRPETTARDALSRELRQLEGWLDRTMIIARQLHVEDMLVPIQQAAIQVQEWIHS